MTSDNMSLRFTKAYAESKTPAAKALATAAALLYVAGTKKGAAKGRADMAAKRAVAHAATFPENVK